MTRPTTRNELLARSTAEFEALLEAVEAIEPARRVGPSDYPRGSVKDMLAHLDAWHRLFLEWERIGRAGEVAAMPATGYTWQTTPDLNMEIHERRAGDRWDVVVADLRESHALVRDVIASYPEDELFVKKRFRWTGSTSVGSYAVSATTSHYDWAMKHLKRSRRAWAAEEAR
ncbi:MAG: ClbS/DfsB family four-helix bundle protein [Candidatus Limnocylindrales bacterium]